MQDAFLPAGEIGTQEKLGKASTENLKEIQKNAKCLALEGSVEGSS